MAYQLSKLAEEDIISIFINGATQFGEAQAKRYHKQLAATFDFLAANPLAAPVRSEINPPVHLHPVGSHLIIYQVIADNDIYIIRVRHRMEDWTLAPDTVTA
jgi:toxin ParE1/3/4